MGSDRSGSDGRETETEAEAEVEVEVETDVNSCIDDLDWDPAMGTLC